MGTDLQENHAALRFWIDEYAFSEGETAILRENIKVRPADRLLFMASPGT